jgi:hypothetical protein
MATKLIARTSSDLGKHTLRGAEITGLLTVAAALLLAYGWHAARVAHPLLRLGLFRIRTLRASVSGTS